MTYKIIKEEVCSACNGDYKEIKEIEDNSRFHRTFPMVVYCLHCKEGMVRTEVSIVEALVFHLNQESPIVEAIRNQLAQ